MGGLCAMCLPWANTQVRPHNFEKTQILPFSHRIGAAGREQSLAALENSTASLKLSRRACAQVGNRDINVAHGGIKWVKVVRRSNCSGVAT